MDEIKVGIMQIAREDLTDSQYDDIWDAWASLMTTDDSVDKDTILQDYIAQRIKDSLLYDNSRMDITDEMMAFGLSMVLIQRCLHE